MNITLADINQNDEKQIPEYNLIISEESLNKIQDYKKDIISTTKRPGEYLNQQIKQSLVPLEQLSNIQFIELIMATKKPSIFAESAIMGGGRDWNNTELEILGDINMAFPVTIYDNGVWPQGGSYPDHFQQHQDPFQGELLFTPGALLKTGEDFAGESPDLTEITNQGRIDQQAYNKLVQRRLLPILIYINYKSDQEGKQAVITMPGIGAGVFAGKYQGTIGNHLNIAMQELLSTYWKHLQNIRLIHYDPFTEGDNEQLEFGNLKYRVRPASKGNKSKSQLSNPVDLEEETGELHNTKLYKIVAWDHVSWPGNDFIAGSKWTDDGIAAGGTNLMKKLMGADGHYDKQTGKYLPPNGYLTWAEYATKNNIKLYVKDNIKVVDNQGEIYQLK